MTRAAACARSKRASLGRDVAGDQRAGRRHADEDRAGPGADRAGRLLAQRGVRLVADDDRVGVGICRRCVRTTGRSRPSPDLRPLALAHQQRARIRLRSCGAQLAVELVAGCAVGRTRRRRCATPRRSRAPRRFTGAGRVLEPALAGVRPPAPGTVRPRSSPAAPPARPRPRRPPRQGCRRTRKAGSSGLPAPLPLPSAGSASSAVSVPDSVDLVGGQHGPVGEHRPPDAAGPGRASATSAGATGPATSRRPRSRPVRRQGRAGAASRGKAQTDPRPPVGRARG